MELEKTLNKILSGSQCGVVFVTSDIYLHQLLLAVEVRHQDVFSICHSGERDA